MGSERALRCKFRCDWLFGSMLVCAVQLLVHQAQLHMTQFGHFPVAEFLQRELLQQNCNVATGVAAKQARTGIKSNCCDATEPDSCMRTPEES